jgi:uncharacterized protein YnzC (UPF0291/DUF896 family)
MGYKYFQTDDRDDYFDSLRTNKKKNYSTITLISPDGNTVLNSVPMYKVRAYAKNNYLPKGQNGKRIWRQLLIDKGYKVINNTIKIADNQ